MQHGIWVTVRYVHMPNTLAACSKRIPKLAAGLVLVAGLFFLTGCQGVSTGGSGTPGQQLGTLSLSATSLSFGTVTIGSNQSLSETLSNTGDSSVTISQVAIDGTGFTLSGIDTPLTLASGDRTSFTVKFTPTTAGKASGNITITSTATNPTLTIPLSGAGTSTVGQLSVTPATLAVGSVAVGTSGTASGGLTATGANVTVTAATTNNSVFTVGGLPLPVTIPAGQSVPFTITFSPAITGAAAATLTVTNNGQASTITEALTGTGTSSSGSGSNHSVALSWSPSSSSGIAGYNIYRADYTDSCQSFSPINGSLDANTVYTDSNVADGASYCYATTAVNTSNEESGKSNIVSNVQIPAQ
jgi:Abnormal spindle-like microcephaly-assoc'd, ASPM-SPD-2-Hydin